MSNTPKVIVSLTSHTKERLANVPFFLFASIIRHNFDFVKIVLTLYKDDVQFIPPQLYTMIKCGLVELIVADVNLRCHLKYFYAMKKYRNLPIITIDDDSVYPSEMIPDLLKLHQIYPDVILARSARLIDRHKPYKDWIELVSGVEKVQFVRQLINQVRQDLNPEGYGGVLYPANILQVSDDLIDEILHFPRADDIYLTVLEQRRKLRSMVPWYSYNKLNLCTRPAFSICTQPDNLSMIDQLIQRYL